MPTDLLDAEDLTAGVDVTFPYHSWIKNGAGASAQGTATALLGTRSFIWLAGSNSTIRRDISSQATDTARLRCKFRMPATVTGDQTLISLFPTGAARPVKLYFKTTKVLRLGDASSSTSSLFSTPALTSGNDYFATLWVQSGNSATAGSVRMTVDTGTITSPLAGHDSGLLTGRDCGAASQITFADFGGSANTSDAILDAIQLDYPATSFMPSALTPIISLDSLEDGIARFTVAVSSGAATYVPSITQISGTPHAAVIDASSLTSANGYVTYKADQDDTVDSVYRVTLTGADGGVSNQLTVTVPHLPIAAGVASVKFWNNTGFVPA
jgi:hypothetical protein